MAIKPEDLFPANSAPPTSDYPLGSARNVTSPGDGTGTPLVASWVNDLWGFFQATLTEAGVTPSGNPDTAQASQYLDSLKAILAPAQFAIGSIQQSILDLAQFQALNGAGWVLMDGSDISGSALATLTGTTTLPDATGCFLRNAGGEAAAVGVVQNDQMQRLYGAVSRSGVTATGAYTGGDGVYARTNFQDRNRAPNYVTIDQVLSRGLIFDSSFSTVEGGARTGSETRPINISVNYFIKIN